MNKKATKKFIPISWQRYEKDAISLAKKIRDEYGRIDEIIAIARGGIVLSRILSDILDARISFITIESYKNFDQQKTPVITHLLSKKFTNEKILLVDELADSGATFLRATAYLKESNVMSFITASLYIKPRTKYVPHFYEEQLNGWIILPYELRETKAAFIEKFGLQEAKKKLRQLGIVDWSTI
ncbi:MAG TPA: phosphoribosyltransferase family protein [Patescibacteria group bacterium]|jgi:hypoxanthine phosphoribosyltransferase|nr:phosphoribosyltransferase family protein [Patescibacteria group bacterium]